MSWCFDLHTGVLFLPEELVFIKGKSSNFIMMGFLFWNRPMVHLVQYPTLANARCLRIRHKFPSPQYVCLGRIFALVFYDAPGQGTHMWLMPTRNVWIRYYKSQTNLVEQFPYPGLVLSLALNISPPECHIYISNNSSSLVCMLNHYSSTPSSSLTCWHGQF